ncbi:nuclear transport factor 2 family protein [Georgenia sp. H159]|uniref:nuclear transport factor 2 family protein n=1 Tax=Georgenia sp. H159 TaxID=3076115 RepID=UPI002D788387|nr:nuclear transport factor 2 family protein [Georgenia sp. H159]
MDENLRGQMQSLLDAWAEAIVANDAERIDAFAEEGWTLIGTGGPTPRERFLDVVRSGRLTHESMTFEVLEVWDRGELVVVLAHGTNSGHWDGRPFEEDEYVTEVFARHDGGWRCVVSSLTPRVVQ